MPQPSDVVVTQRGDLWKLGKHYLLCGDARDPDDVARLMQGSKADLLFTDPPCNVRIDGHVHDMLSMAGQVEASAAAAFITRQANLGHAHDARSLRGMLVVALPNLQSVSEFEMRLRKERANYRDSLRRSIDEAQSANPERSNQFAHLLGRARRLGMAVLRSHRTRDDARLQHFGDEFTKARASIGEVENTYREYMKLRAPVEYWESKAGEHGKSASKHSQP